MDTINNVDAFSREVVHFTRRPITTHQIDASCVTSHFFVYYKGSLWEPSSTFPWGRS